MADRRRLSAPERRVTIVEAGRSVFLESGYEGARTSAIAKRAGVNEAMLYQHFESKEDIFKAAVLDPLRDRLDDFVEAVRTAAAEEQNPAELVARLETLWLSSMTRTAPLLAAALLSDRESGRETYRRVVAPVLAEVEEKLRAVVPEGQPVRTITRALFGLNMLLALDSMVLEKPVPADELSAQLGKVLVSGMSA